MIINMPPERLKSAAKRLKKLLREMGYEISHTKCLHLSAELVEFKSWQHYCHRQFAPVSPFDQDIPEEEFLARDEFQMKILEAAGFGAHARELLDRANPTGCWSKKVEVCDALSR